MSASLARWMFLLLLPWPAQADLTIFDMRKNLPMAESDPVYHDYVINGGSEAGLSVGMVLTVQRRIPLYDSYQNRSAGDLQLKVARVKIIHVQKGMAVARLQSEFNRESIPILEDNFIMIGDRIDLASAGSDKKADNGNADGSAGQASVESAKPETTPPPPPAPSAANVQTSKTSPQIVVNSVELSSSAAAKEKGPIQAPVPGKVDVPVRQ